MKYHGAERLELLVKIECLIISELLKNSEKAQNEFLGSVSAILFLLSRGNSISKRSSKALKLQCHSNLTPVSKEVLNFDR